MRKFDLGPPSPQRYGRYLSISGRYNATHQHRETRWPFDWRKKTPIGDTTFSRPVHTANLAGKVRYPRAMLADGGVLSAFKIWSAGHDLTRSPFSQRARPRGDGLAVRKLGSKASSSSRLRRDYFPIIFIILPHTCTTLTTATLPHDQIQRRVITFLKAERKAFLMM